MNARFLVLALALAVALLATAPSARAASETINLPAGLSIISMPLNHPSGNNSLNNTIVLTDLDIGATIFRYDTTTQSYGDAIQWAGTFLGWLTADLDPNWRVINPGEAFWIQLVVPASITFNGDEPTGTLNNPLPGDGQLAMRSSMEFTSAQLGSPGFGLEWPGVTGDTIYVWDNVTQSYKQPYQYLGGLGWLSANFDDEGLNGPTIPIGSGFFCQMGIGSSATWTQTGPPPPPGE